MTTIQFTIDADEYEVKVNPPMGDPDKVYRSQDEIRDRVEQAGYEFVDEPPQYRILATKHKKSRDPSIIDLGDITGKVRPVEAETPPGPEGREEDGEEQTVPQDPDEIEVTLVGPDGDEDTRTYGEGQALGSVAADLKRINDISYDNRVVIYRSRERNRELPRETMMSSIANERLFWDVEDRL